MPQPGDFEPFRCDVRRGRRGVVSLAPVGELDDATAAEAARALQEAQARRPRVLIIDLRGLAFMDSAGSHLLLEARAWARAAAVELVIIQGHRAVRRLLEVAKVDHLLPLIDRQPVEPMADAED